MKRKLAGGAGTDFEAAPARLVRDSVEREYPLEDLDPTQRAFTSRFLGWVRDVAEVYHDVRDSGKRRSVPKLRSWLGGSAGSGKSTTLKVFGGSIGVSDMDRRQKKLFMIMCFPGVTFNLYEFPCKIHLFFLRLAMSEQTSNTLPNKRHVCSMGV